MKKSGLKKKAGSKGGGNKTVQKPAASVNMQAAKGGMSEAGMKRGYDVKGKMPVLSSPHTSPNDTAKN